MGRRDAERRGRPALDPAPLALAGAAFLERPLLSPSLGLGAGRSRHPSGALGFARRVLSWRRRSDPTVTCIACGASVPRGDAREYDKHGDRFDRADKRFEYLCKRCHRDIDHKPRPDLEGLLVEFEAGDHPREEFLAWYCDRVEHRDGPREHD